MKNLIIQKSGKQALDYFSKFTDVESEKTFVFSSTNIFNILNNNTKPNAIINLSRTNDIRFVNKFFEAVNSKLTNEGIFIGCLETIASRMERMSIGKIPFVGAIYFT